MPDSELFTFFNEHPVLPIVVISANVVAYFPILFLLYISQIAPLHANCRYILCVWVLGYSVFFAVNIGLATLDLANPTGYMPRSMIVPYFRFTLYQWYYMCSIFGSLIEIALSIERLVSVIHPQRYHFSKMAWKPLIALTTIMMAVSDVVESAVHSQDSTHRLVGYTLLSAIEISVLTAGIAATRVCRTRYEKMYGNATLTERYQAKEAYEMSKAMVPGYIISFTLKASTILVLSIYLELKDWNLTGYAQDYLILTTVGSGTFSMVNLLLKHPQLRKQTIRKLRMRMEEAETSRRISVTEETDTYFSMLSASWK